MHSLQVTALEIVPRQREKPLRGNSERRASPAAPHRESFDLAVVLKFQGVLARFAHRYVDTRVFRIDGSQIVRKFAGRTPPESAPTRDDNDDNERRRPMHAS